MEKYNKILSKMYKDLVQHIVQQNVHQKVKQKMQQKLQQKVHSNYVAHLIKRFVLAKLLECLLTKPKHRKFKFSQNFIAQHFVHFDL